MRLGVRTVTTSMPFSARYACSASIFPTVSFVASKNLSKLIMSLSAPSTWLRWAAGIEMASSSHMVTPNDRIDAESGRPVGTYPAALSWQW